MNGNEIFLVKIVFSDFCHWRRTRYITRSKFSGAISYLIGPRQNDRNVADDIFTCIFLNENVRILINISLKFVPTGQINNIPALVQIMAWCRSGDKPLSEPIVLVYWRIYTSLGLNELSHKHLKTHGYVLVEAPGHQYPQG